MGGISNMLNRTWLKRRSLAPLFVMFLVFLAFDAGATRIKDLCEIQGARGNALKGIGLVVGLAGTGDKTSASLRAQERMLRRMGVEVAGVNELKSDNVAVVMVNANLPAFAKEGTRIDVQVSSLYDCESLEGGTLLETQLEGMDGEVYAVAQGAVSIGGFNADAGGGAQVRNNHVTAGRVPNGAYVEREVPSTITDGERFILLLKRPDFGAARNIKDAINAAVGRPIAAAFGAGTVSVLIPETERRDLVEFIARVQEIEVDGGQPNARVVINERTGTIVVGGNVRIRPCQVAHGGLTITIARTPQVSQPPPFSPGETVVTETAELEVTATEARLLPVEGTSAAEVAEALNRLKVTPRDVIAIFQALKEAAVMDADLEIM